MCHLLSSAHHISCQCKCNLGFFQTFLAFLLSPELFGAIFNSCQKNLNILLFSLNSPSVRPCSRPRYTSQPCFLVSPFFVPLVLTPWFLVPGAWPRRVSLEEPERRWREKGGRAGAERQTPKPQLQQPCLALPSLSLPSLH